MGQGLGKTGWTIVKFLNFVFKRTSENAGIASRGKLVFWKDRLHVPNSDQKCSRSAILLMSTFETHGWEFITDNEHSESNIFIHIWHRWAPHGPYVVTSKTIVSVLVLEQGSSLQRALLIDAEDTKSLAVDLHLWQANWNKVELL